MNLILKFYNLKILNIKKITLDMNLILKFLNLKILKS